MSACTRWIAFGVALVVVLGLVALYVLNFNLTGMSMEESDGQRIWTIQLGDSVSLSADEVGPDDIYRCADHGAVHGTPEPGRAVVGADGHLFVGTDDGDGSVTMSCAAGVDWALT